MHQILDADDHTPLGSHEGNPPEVGDLLEIGLQPFFVVRVEQASSDGTTRIFVSRNVDDFANELLSARNTNE